jgi:hypothetical protein
VVVEFTTTYVSSVSPLTLWIPLVPRCIEYRAANEKIKKLKKEREFLSTG